MSVEKNTGWVRFYRKSLESTVFEDPKIWFVWSWCLMKANHETKGFPFNGRDITVERGSFITGRSKALSELRGLTARSYRTAINYLKTTNRITSKATNKFTIITVCNYDIYQPEVLQDDQQNDQQNDQPTTNKRPTNDQPTTTNKNYKNDKNEKNEENIARRKSSFLPPSVEEVKSFFKERGYAEEAAVKAWNHYELAKWHDTSGKPVLNWRQKMNTVWFKPENRMVEHKLMMP